ncbi:hypothetical protein CG740_37230 [Streptomyces sp. CB01201]|uniref:hypothetical protein n=1 Tax=Streptomyces sp. CB01201 TaxID=2020324 RepID=UPI000C26FB7A|nr:hypothetical protein [Streptomyces sp. CB01201]PJM98129.1 hypothetical protein CG740_37230 [Streptomyces sp. CB01201]
MTIPSSSAPAVRRYLHDQCSAQLAADPLNKRVSLLVCYDDPGPNEPGDIVSIGRIARTINPNSLVGSGGAGWLEEQYTVTVTIDLFRGDDNAQAIFERAALLVDQVCAIVRTDPSLGGLVLESRPVSSEIEGEWDGENQGRHVLATLEIHCYQRT